MVFPVSQSKLIDRKSVVIVGSPRVLLFDEVPILFTGKTEFGSHVIGSSVIDDRENDFERYFHILVTNKDFRDFHAGNVSYLELLKNAHPIYVIDRATDSEIISYIEFQAIPDQFRPTVHTYFPESAREPTIEYMTKLEGGSATNHLADPKHVSTIQNQISEVLQKSLHALQMRMGFTIDTKLSPATASSYGINYVITLEDIQPVRASEKDLLKFVNDFTEFCFEHLPSEIESLLDETSVDRTSPHFQDLFNEALRLYPMIAKNEDDLNKRKEELRNDLKKDVLAVPPLLETVSEIVRTSYSSLELSNNGLPLGMIDQNFNSSLIEVLAKLNEETIDDRLRTFRIMVYSFNKHSGKGRSDVLIGDQVSQIYIHLLEVNASDGEATDAYIESMKEDKYFDVVGRMTYRGNRPHRLEI